MDIKAWLQGLSLQRYVPAFCDNEIDWEVLPKLTSEDLKEIGVSAAITIWPSYPPVDTFFRTANKQSK